MDSVSGLSFGHIYLGERISLRSRFQTKHFAENKFHNLTVSLIDTLPFNFDAIMDDALYQQSMHMQPPNPPFTDFSQQPLLPDPCVAPPSRSHPMPGLRHESEVKDARRIQKADREKLRRDRLNEHFIELGHALDTERPKNDKATILTDTIQLLKDLSSQVKKLEAEYTALTEESRELTQEKTDLREEKSSLKSDIENLNIQYQQRLRSMHPWVAMDHSVVMAPTSYPYPMPLTMPPGPIPLHPSMQPYPFFGNQNPGVIHNPCSTFVPYLTPNTMVDHQFAQHASSLARPASGSHVSGKQDSKNKSSGESKTRKCLDSNDVTTELELKTPGSTTDQDSSSGYKKPKKSSKKEDSVAEGSSSSRCSSARSVQNSSSASMVGSTEADDLGQ